MCTLMIKIVKTNYVSLRLMKKRINWFVLNI